MVITFLSWAYLFFLFLIYGTEVLSWIQYAIFGEAQDAQVHMSLRIILGMVFLGVIGMWLSLFLPLGEFVNLLFLFGAIFLALRNWSLYKLEVSRLFTQPYSYFVLAIFLVAFAFALISSSGKSENPDTLLYHIQTIRWIETYPAIPGLANLHFRLAFNSSWLLVNALFGFSFLLGQPLHSLLGFLFVLASWYFLDGYSQFISTKSYAELFRLFLFPLMVYIAKSELSSPGTDVPAILFMWFGVSLFWFSLEGSSFLTFVYGILAVIFSLFAVSIKLSVLPILIIPVFVFLRSFWSRRLLFLLSFLTLFILSPWIGRSVILSGYLVYPLPAIDIFSVDWKVPLSRVTDVHNAILAFARMPELSVDYVITLPFWAWFTPWFAKLTIFRQILMATSLLSPFILGLRYLLTPKIHKYLQLLYLFSYIGLLYWLVTAPAYRFGFGFISLVVLFLFFMLLSLNFAHLAKLIAVSTLVFAFLYPAYLVQATLQGGNVRDQLIFPIAYESPRTDICFIDNAELACARTYGWCGYESFPCAVKIKSDVLLRGANWENGFRLADGSQ